jgi:phosphoribosyl-dephospho-CoA transferase
MSDRIASRLGQRPWLRHELLRLAPGFWPQALASGPAIGAAPALRIWADHGWPVMVRQRVAGERAEMVPIGVSLPPFAGKQRIALAIHEQAVLERSPPPSLWAVRHVVDRSWMPTLRALVMLGARHAVTPAAIGSLLWQYRTGLRYLSPQSDLGLLWRAHGGYDLGDLLAGIAAEQQSAPMRIDGEIVFPDGTAVNWRELHHALRHGIGEVLVKSLEGIRLMNVAQLMGAYRQARTR